MSTPDPPETQRVVVARAQDERAEVALARRGAVTELIVDGVFAMDTVDTGTERALARLALDCWQGDDGQRLEERDAAPRPEARVLVGGLGLGFTTAALLADPRVGGVHVVELHAAIVEWARAGMLPLPAAALSNPRLTVTVADVVDLLPRLPAGSFDALLLDVDNGPGFLIHPPNAAVYEPRFLRTALHLLAPGGVLAVWSADRAPALADALRTAGADCREVTLPVRRDGRDLEYAVYLAVAVGGR